MNEARVYADGFQTSFTSANEMMGFLADRTKATRWLRRPTKELRLVPLQKGLEKMNQEEVDELREVLKDTERNMQLLLKTKGETYPVRNCAIKSILSRAGVSGDGLRKLEKTHYARVVNYCLQVAKGNALIKIADGKVSAVHGGDQSDYSVLDIQSIFEMTMQYLNIQYPGNSYVEGSGAYDHEIVTAMWELGGQQDLLDVYRDALDCHGLKAQVAAPAVRLVTSDVAASCVTLHPMLLCKNPSRTIYLGSPIKLEHKNGTDLTMYQDNLRQLYSRYTQTIEGLTRLMDIEIKHPINCLMQVLEATKIKRKKRKSPLKLYVCLRRSTGISLVRLTTFTMP